MQVPDYWPGNGYNVVQFFKDAKNRDIIAKIIEAGVNWENEEYEPAEQHYLPDKPGF